MTLTVLGAGAFGTALAITQCENQSVILWGHNENHCAQMAASGENEKRLPGTPFPKNLEICSDLETTIKKSSAVMFAVPLQATDVLVEQVHAIRPDVPVIGCSKGIDLSTGLGGYGLLERLYGPNQSAVLTGPSFAVDIARGKPTALTLATTSSDLGAVLQQALSTPSLRIYLSNDPIGAELGGGLKNVIAIACGIVMGANLGESARAAIITRGFAEMQKFATAQGAQLATLAGLSGFGDLCLTCTSEKSRNYKYGFQLGQGQPVDTSQTVEGMHTAKAMLNICEAQQIDMPITTAVANVVSGKYTVPEAMEKLMARPLKKES